MRSSAPDASTLPQFFPLVVYHRYATLLSEEKVSIVHNMVNAAIKMTHELSNASKDSLRVLGPAPVSLFRVRIRDAFVNYSRSSRAAIKLPA